VISYNPKRRNRLAPKILVQTMTLKNGRYYQKSIWRNGRCVTEYVGSGEFGALMHAADLLIADEERARREEIRRGEHEQAVARQAQREARQALGKRLDFIDCIMAGYYRRIGKTVEAILATLGYHRHARGRWRRRRKPMSNPLATASVAELVKLARECDRITLGELSYRADERLYETVEALGGDLGRTIVEPMLLNLNLGTDTGFYSHKEGVAAKLAIMRQELAPYGSSIAEELLAERAALCWLNVQFMEIDRIDLLQQTKPDYRKIAMIDQCLSRAQARFTQALIALAKIRRLKIPATITQVNVGNQVNAALQANGDFS
jgi:hypothetical protein